MLILLNKINIQLLDNYNKLRIKMFISFNIGYCRITANI
jgi:hypothetical protein